MSRYSVYWFNHLIIPKVGTFVISFYYYYFNSSSHFKDAEAEVQSGLRSCGQGRIHSFFSGVYPGPVPKRSWEMWRIKRRPGACCSQWGEEMRLWAEKTLALLLVEPWEVDRTSLRKYVQELEPWTLTKILVGHLWPGDRRQARKVLMIVSHQFWAVNRQAWE